MIGGSDIHIDLPAGAAAIDFAVRAIRHFWPQAVFENANSTVPAADYSQLDFDGLTEVMAYKDRASAAAWDRLGADPSLDGTLIHLIATPTHLTVVVDDKPSAEMKAIVQTISQGLKRGERRIAWKEAA